tara:strand:- start:162 stop:1163 length:1002 start_codon:yes stop_codon:yes gene_type:complete
MRDGCMLLEDKILYEIKKENYNKAKEKYFLSTVNECARLERKLLRRGWKRERVNSACIDLIEYRDKQFKQHLINENVFSSAVGFLLPGLGDYFKKLFIQYVFKQLGINPDSPLAGFFVNVLRNIHYKELFNYMKSGRCPYIVESLTKAVMDQFVDYIKGQLFAGAVKGGLDAPKYGTLEKGTRGPGGMGPPSPDKFHRPTFIPPNPTAGSPATGTQTYAGADVESGFLQKAGEKLMLSTMPKAFLQFFQSPGIKGLAGGGIEEILRNNVKQHLLPPLIKSLQRVICEGLDFSQLDKQSKTITSQAKEADKKATKPEESEEIKDVKNEKETSKK